VGSDTLQLELAQSEREPAGSKMDKKAKKIQLEKNEDAYERPGDLYRVIADAAGLGWLHLPSQEVFDAMQDRRRASSPKKRAASSGSSKE
jgi:hypothetical protein